jgi:hypothetical protein
VAVVTVPEPVPVRVLVLMLVLMVVLVEHGYLRHQQVPVVGLELVGMFP